MRMIAILLSALLRPYMGWFEAWRTAPWPEKYFDALSRRLFKSTQFAWVQFVILFAPIALVLFFIQSLLGGIQYGALLLVILGVFSLLYVQGVITNTHKLDRFFAAAEQNDAVAMSAALASYQDAEGFRKIENSEMSATGQLSRIVLTQANEKIFSTLFWFLLLGPAGLLCYASVVRMRRWAVESDEDHRAFAILLKQFIELLEWIPARFGVLSYAVVGNFTGAVDCAMSCRLGGWGEDENERLMLTAGLGAIGERGGRERLQIESLEQLRDARDLVSRAHMLWLSVAAVATLIGLLS